MDSYWTKLRDTGWPSRYGELCLLCIGRESARCRVVKSFFIRFEPRTLASDNPLPPSDLEALAQSAVPKQSTLPEELENTARRAPAGVQEPGGDRGRMAGDLARRGPDCVPHRSGWRPARLPAHGCGRRVIAAAPVLGRNERKRLKFLRPPQVAGLRLDPSRARPSRRLRCQGGSGHRAVGA